jgi:hypothetical protein
MFKLFIAIVFLNISTNAMAKSPAIRDTSCNFLKKLKFKNGLDTLVVKTTYLEVANMIPISQRFETLDKEAKIKSKAFTYQLGIQPEGCSKIYYGPCSYKGNINNVRSGTVFYVTCIAFERHDLEYKGVPFFVIIDVSVRKLTIK